MHPGAGVGHCGLVLVVEVYLSVHWLVMLTCLGEEDHLLGPNLLVVQRPPPFHEGRDLNHYVSACSEGAGGMGGGGGFLVRPHFCWGGRGSKRAAPLFPGLQGAPAHSLHPRFVVAEIWADCAEKGP